MVAKKAARKVGRLLGPLPAEPIWQWRNHRVTDPVLEPDRPVRSDPSDEELFDRAIELGLDSVESIEAFVRGQRAARQSAAPVPLAPELLEHEDEDLGLLPGLVP